MASKRRLLEVAAAARSEWQNQWMEALAALGLDIESSPDAVAAQVDAIDEMRTTVFKVKDTGERSGGVAAG